MKRRLAPSELLMSRLESELGLEIPDNARFRRLYPGHMQRDAGAWVWCIERPPLAELGSQLRVSDLLKCAKLCTYRDHRTTGMIDIYPGKEKP